jgi:hypothetical protein
VKPLSDDEERQVQKMLEDAGAYFMKKKGLL